MVAVTSDSDAVRSALRVLWQDHREVTTALLEDVGRAVGDPRPDVRDAARRRPAHRLAGSLGTFGMPEGTALARRLEAAFEPDAPPSDPARVGRLVAELTDVIERFDRSAPAETSAPPPTRRRGRTVAVVGFAEPLATRLGAELTARRITPLEARDLDTVLRMARTPASTPSSWTSTAWTSSWRTSRRGHRTRRRSSR